MTISSPARTGVPFLAITGLLLLSAPAQAQDEERSDCRLRKDASGMIRGDRVPRGCVLRSQPERKSSRGVIVFPTHPGLVVSGDAILIVGVPARGGVRRVPLEGARRRGSFGPLFRKFGPLERKFGPLERNFGKRTRRADRDEGNRPPPRR